MTDDERFLKALRIDPQSADAPKQESPEPDLRAENLAPHPLVVRFSEDGEAVQMATEDFQRLMGANAQLTAFGYILTARVTRYRYAVGVMVVALVGMGAWIWLR